LPPSAGAATSGCTWRRIRGTSTGLADDGRELDDLNRRIQKRLVKDGVVFATGGMLPSGFSLRPAIVSCRSNSADVLLLAEEVIRLEMSSTVRRWHSP
jgi:hypothetical protein